MSGENLKKYIFDIVFGIWWLTSLKGVAEVYIFRDLD